MIKLVVFSRNRAQQLDLALRSIRKHTQDTEGNDIFDISVIIKADNTQYAHAYEKLQRMSGTDGYPNFKLYHEGYLGDNFRDSVLREISEERNMHQFTMFLTDDCVMYRSIYEFPIYDLDRIMGDVVACVSLRMGLNVTIQTYYKGDKLPELDYTIYTTVSNSKYIAWNHKDYHPHSHYGYVLSVDGHIFRTSIIRDILEGNWWESPNTIEANLCGLTHELPPVMMAPDKQVVVACPVNEVAGFGNKYGVYHGLDLEEANLNYLRGKRLDLDHICEYLRKHSFCTHTEYPSRYENE